MLAMLNHPSRTIHSTCRAISCNGGPQIPKQKPVVRAGPKGHDVDTGQGGGSKSPGANLRITAAEVRYNPVLRLALQQPCIQLLHQ